MIQSLQRGIRILEYLVENKTAGCSDVANELAINKSSAFRLLQTLQQFDLVAQDPDSSKYMLGIGVLRFSEELLNGMNIVDVAKPVMKALVKEINEGAHLCMLSNNKAAIIADIKSEAKIIVSAKVGAFEPLHCSSVGKCLLAFCNPEKRAELFDSLDMKQYTEKTITSTAGLIEELERTVENGYALDDEELNEGIRCIAAPIKNHRGDVKYCVAISGTIGRVENGRVEYYAKAVMGCAKEISEKMGYSGKRK